MKPYQRKLIKAALKKKVLKFGEFILKSGRRSPYFFNIGLFNSGEDLVLLGQSYAEAIISSGLDCDVLFGPAYKGIPIVVATTIAMATQHNRVIPYCFNRKERKYYGEGGNLIGSPLRGKVVLVDDVITAGTAVRESMEIIKNHGATLSGVLISLDRQEQFSKNISAIKHVEYLYGCKVISIITLQDLITYLEDNPEMGKHLKAVKAYQEQFGIFSLNH